MAAQWRGRTATIQWGLSRRSIADPRINQGIGDIDHQIDQHIDKAEQQYDALDHGIVPTQDRVDRQPAQARNREHAFGHQRAADQQRDTDADYRHDRNGGVFQRVNTQNAALIETLGASGADIILLQYFKHGRSRDARDQRGVDRTEGHRRQDQVL